MKKVLIIVGIILLVVGLIITASVFVFSNFNFKNINTSEDYESKTFNIEDEFNNINISIDTSDLVFKHAKDGKTTIECLERKNMPYKVYVENGTLKVETEDNRQLTDYMLTYNTKQTMTVYLPGERYEKLEIKNVTGDTNIPETFSFVNLKVLSSTGDIICKASVDDVLSIDLTTGHIEVEGIKSNEISLISTTGKISAKDIECTNSFTLNVSTGSSNITNVKCKSFSSDGSTGTISLTNVIATGKMEITRSSGDIKLDKCDAEEMNFSLHTGDIKGTILSEKIFITKTSTGKIDVPASTTGGKCTITTSTGDIKISMEK